MATAEFTVGSPMQRRRRRPLKFFFVLMVALAAAILGFAFIPEFVAYARGTFPIEAIVHVHAALMLAWVTAFAVQVYLGVRGKIVQHQRAGRVAVAIAWTAWASMIFVEWRAILVHPLPADLSTYDELLTGPYVYLTFPVFLAWAYHERRRPMWHKRLMLIALFLSLQAAVQRYLWLPMYHYRGGYWPIMAFIDVALVVPLVAFDLKSLKGRLHPATTRGIAVLLVAQGITLALWGTTAWRELAYTVTHAVRRLA